jgi:hypothetical protein
MKMIDGGWGSFLKYKMLTDTRAFELVEAALEDSGIKALHPGVVLLERPKASTAFTRSMGYLTRVCAASIPFPAGSPNAEGERNPNYSLKIESVKGTPEGEIAYRINLSDRRLANQDMAHVLLATHRPGLPVEIMPGEQAAWDKFGEDIAKLVRDANDKFQCNYDDTDVRDVVVKELQSLSAVNVLGKTTNFIAKDSEAKPNNTLRAQKLMEFVHACGHECTLLGLDGTEMTRDAIVSELRASIMAELEEYEADLDEKLGAKTKERQRGEKQRLRMMTTASKNIDEIMALAEYHATVLGVMAEGIKEKADALRAKATEFLTRDFGTGVPAQKSAATSQPVSALEKRIAELEAANAKLLAEKTAQAAPVVVEASEAFAEVQA